MQKTSYIQKILHIYILTAITALAFSFASFQALAFGTADDISQSPLVTEFKKLDSNHDGKLTRSEATRDDDLTGSFDRADENHNGTLTNDEYGTFKSALQKKRMEEFLDDSTVTAKVKAELIKDVGMKGLHISVETHKGKVILSGFVENEQQLRRALQIASGIRGVQSITNGLVIKG